MSRIEPASPPYPPSVQARLAAIMPPGVPPLWLFRVLARDERLFARSIGSGMLDRGNISLRDRELVILRTCALYRSEYEWGVHVAGFAKRAGLSEEQVHATTRPGTDAACFSPHERNLLALCDELCASTEVSDTLWQALAAEHSDEALLELLLLCGFYRTISILTNTLRMPLEPYGARFASSPAR